jgi:hypothetical protein
LEAKLCLLDIYNDILATDWWQIVATSGEFQVFGGYFLMLDLDGELRLDMFRKGVYKD